MTWNDPSTDTSSGLATAIRVRKEELGMKRKDLAERSNLSYPYVSELEKGTKEPSARAFRQLAEALELSPTELLAMSERYAGAPTTSPVLRQLVTEATVALTRGEPPLASDIDIRTDRASAASDAPAELTEIITRIVRSELETFANEVLPGLVATELRRTLALGVERGSEG
jgi:transcriptional regulator with XRE-family HTH domain